jgi:hypothetical protein
VSRIGPRAPAAVELATRRSLADLLWIANTRHGPGGHWFARVTDDGDHDHLRMAADAVRYLADHHVEIQADEPGPLDLDGLAAVREMTRGLLEVCRLVFLDGSKSGTRRWCDDAGCGNRFRVRRHRREHGSAATWLGGRGDPSRRAPSAP